MKTNSGSGHGNVANFEFSVLGGGIPDGKGGFLPGRFEPITCSGPKNVLSTFKTADGKEHSGGKVEASDVTMTFYCNDPVVMASLTAWWIWSRSGGANLPCQFTERTTDDKVANVWATEAAFMKEFSGGDLDRNTPNPSIVTCVFSVYDPTRIPL